jgi:hypothetical protein
LRSSLLRGGGKTSPKLSQWSGEGLFLLPRAAQALAAATLLLGADGDGGQGRRQGDGDLGDL